MRLIEGSGVSKHFGGLIALNNVDFYVDENEIVGLIRPSGAGKTTLFNVISGVYTPTSGVIRFRGTKISGMKPYKICRLGLARTFQIPKPFPNMTVYENVLSAAVFGRIESGKSSDFKQELQEILEKF